MLTQSVWIATSKMRTEPYVFSCVSESWMVQTLQALVVKTLNFMVITAKVIQGVPVVAQHVTNPMSIHEDASSFPGLTQWVKDRALP